jgi:hypothetical protein
MTPLERELVGMLEECAEFLDGYVDVDDGDDGQPIPNKAMMLVSDIDEVLARVVKSEVLARAVKRSAT